MPRLAGAALVDPPAGDIALASRGPEQEVDGEQDRVLVRGRQHNMLGVWRPGKRVLAIDLHAMGQWRIFADRCRAGCADSYKSNLPCMQDGAHTRSAQPEEAGPQARRYLGLFGRRT